MQDKRELLKQPIHGIYIPVALILFGTWIFSWSYMPYSIAFIAVILSYKFYGAISRRSSLHKIKWQDFELIDKTLIAPMTSIYRFKLNNEKEILDIPTGHHVSCCFTIDGKDEMRYYSPISNQFDVGFFDILVKHYKNGVVTKKLANLQIGQTCKFRGPFGKLEYKPNMCNELGLIAGGTGITPILQVITAIITNLEDNTKINLLFANETEKDILLKSELDDIAEKYPNLTIHYTLTYPPEDWKQGKGYVSKEMIETQLPKPIEGNKIFICGPPEMKKLCIELTQEVGWNKDQIFCF